MSIQPKLVRYAAISLVVIQALVADHLCIASDFAKPMFQPGTARVSFQFGVDQYAGTVDTEIWALAPSTFLESNPNASSDADNDGGESQVLIRFEGILGNGPKQIPKGTRIVSARMIVSAFDQGSTVNLQAGLAVGCSCRGSRPIG